VVHVVLLAYCTVIVGTTSSLFRLSSPPLYYGTPRSLYPVTSYWHISIYFWHAQSSTTQARSWPDFRVCFFGNTNTCSNVRLDVSHIDRCEGAEPLRGVALHRVQLRRGHVLDFRDYSPRRRSGSEHGQPRLQSSNSIGIVRVGKQVVALCRICRTGQIWACEG
jgi:hypothetical protein